MRISDLPRVMVICLLCTIVIECGIALILGYRKKDLLNVLLVNLLTNPVVSSVPVYFNYHYGLRSRNIVLLILEIITLIVEGFIYVKVLKRRKINGFLLSFILNLSSYLIGLLISPIVF